MWQPSLFVFIHYSSFPLCFSWRSIPLFMHAFQQFTVETHFSPLHQINLFTRQYFLELIKVGLVQPVRSDTGIIYTFHNFLILGFGCFFIFPLSEQRSCNSKYNGKNLAASSLVSPAFSVINAFCLARNSSGDRCWSHPSLAQSRGIMPHIITNKTISFFIFK